MDILAGRWPSLSTAMSRYEKNTAEHFSRLAYEAVEHGLIRQEQRQLLAEKAQDIGLGAFDAQLLIACAVRQWAMDHQHDASPNFDAPELSFEYKSWHRAWIRFGLLIGFAAAMDLVIILKWLS